MLPSLIFFWLRLVMAVKHGWLFNSLAAVELLTQFLVRVVVNLAFVSPLSKYKYSFFLCCICHSFVLSHLQLAAGKEWSEQPQHKTSAVPLPCCTHGYCIWAKVAFFPDDKYLWNVLVSILFFGDSGLKTLHGLVWVIHWHWLCIIASWFYCGLGGSALRGGFSPLQLWGIWIQLSWWSFAMCGWTDTTLMVTAWFCCQSIQSSALLWQYTQSPSICCFMLTNEFWWILLLLKTAVPQWLKLLQFFIQHIWT